MMIETTASIDNIISRLADESNGDNVEITVVNESIDKSNNDNINVIAANVTEMEIEEVEEIGEKEKESGKKGWREILKELEEKDKEKKGKELEDEAMKFIAEASPAELLLFVKDSLEMRARETKLKMFVDGIEKSHQAMSRKLHQFEGFYKYVSYDALEIHIRSNN